LFEFGVRSEFVFPNEYGERLSQSTCRHRWEKYRDYHELSKVAPYELRHTFVSVIKRLPEGLLKQLVGHSKDMDTYGVYSHEFDDDMSVSAKLIEETFAKYIPKI